MLLFVRGARACGYYSILDAFVYLFSFVERSAREQSLFDSTVDRNNQWNVIV